MKLPPPHLFVRDVIVVIATALAWWFEPGLREGALAWPVAIGTGLLTAIVGFLAHEYGHLSASLATGARVSYPSSPLSTLLFHFDSAKNDRRQFLWMSLGGYMSSVIGIGLIVVLVPHDAWAGRISVLLAVAGLVVTFVLEVPITMRVFRGAPLPLDAAYRPHQG